MLKVYTEDGTPSEAFGLVKRVNDLNLTQIADAYMNGFWVARNPKEKVAICTTGALTCLIMVVHTKEKTGALGHYPGDARRGYLLAGLEDMVRALGSVAVDTVVFAAGLVEEKGFHQSMHQLLLRVRTMQLLGSCTVVWPQNYYGSCVYLPSTEEVALFENRPDVFEGSAKSTTDGPLRQYPYASINV